VEPIVIWDLDDDSDGNVAHVAEHGVTRDEVEEILQNEDNETDASASSGRPIFFSFSLCFSVLFLVSVAGIYRTSYWQFMNREPKWWTAAQLAFHCGLWLFVYLAASRRVGSSPQDTNLIRR
jgi:hypothetical protein